MPHSVVDTAPVKIFSVLLKDKRDWIW